MEVRVLRLDGNKNKGKQGITTTKMYACRQKCHELLTLETTVIPWGHKPGSFHMERIPFLTFLDKVNFSF